MLCPSCSKECSKEWDYCPYCKCTLPKANPFPEIMNAKVKNEDISKINNQRSYSFFKAIIFLVHLGIGIACFNDWNIEK